jgi:formate C-acetyltransferase
MEICIEPWQLIVGNFASRPFRTSVFPEYSWQWIIDEMETLSEREGDKFIVSGEVKKQLLQLSWWKGRSVRDRVMAMLAPEAREQIESGVISSGLITSGIGQYLPGYEKILRLGIRAIQKDIAERIKETSSSEPVDSSKRIFYESLSIVCEAVIRFAERYARIALKLSESEKDSHRRDDLLQIAAVCRKVFKEPASSFHEAVQSFWFLHLLAYLEIDGAAISAGRLDQYLYPYYRGDIDSGRLTAESAGRILRSLWINFNQILTFYPDKTTSIWAGYPMTQQPSLAGFCADGRDATNELSLLMVKVEDEIRLPQPDIAILYHDGIDRGFLEKACLLLSHTMKPKFFNSSLAMEHLREKGVRESEIFDFSNLGCVTTAIAGASWGPTNYGFINLGKCVELALNDGKDPLRETVAGPGTGSVSRFQTFEDLYQAYTQQVDYAIGQLAAVAIALETVHREYLPLPYASLMVEDCIEKGRDVASGGARYNIPGLQAVGLSTATDSLFAIREIVFEKKAASLADFVNAVRDNFGKDRRLLRMIQEIPKYGNDIEEVDLLARRLGENFCQEVRRHKSLRGVPFLPALYSISAHAGMGQFVGATPDGRKARDPLADGISPGQGRCIEGPTAVVKSVSRVNHRAALNGTLLNMKFSANIIQDPRKLEKFIALIDVFMKLGGYHVQFNVIDTAMLREAQKYPEKYPDLLVRVAAYVSQFTILPKHLQDDIISRSEFGL